MSRAERGLVLLLRLEAIVLFCALPAALMPTAWMDMVHRALGMGPLPRSPLVEYLTRSLSLLYTCWAPLLLVLACDVRRYLPVIWVLNWVRLGMGLSLATLDASIALPTIWALAEGPVVVALSIVGILLTRSIRQDERR